MKKIKNKSVHHVNLNTLIHWGRLFNGHCEQTNLMFMNQKQDILCSFKSEFTLKVWGLLNPLSGITPPHILVLPLKKTNSSGMQSTHTTGVYAFMLRVPSHILYPLTHLVGIELTGNIFRFFSRLLLRSMTSCHSQQQ